MAQHVEFHVSLVLATVFAVVAGVRLVFVVNHLVPLQIALYVAAVLALVTFKLLFLVVGFHVQYQGCPCPADVVAVVASERLAGMDGLVFFHVGLHVGTVIALVADERGQPVFVVDFQFVSFQVFLFATSVVTKVTSERLVIRITVVFVRIL